MAIRPADPGVQLTIRDQGVGIPADHLSRVFEPDFTTKSGGMGLGLAIVENIIIGHGGSIGVQSKAGLGTTFTIHLPLTAVAVDGQTNQGGTS